MTAKLATEKYRAQNPAKPQKPVVFRTPLYIALIE